MNIEIQNVSKRFEDQVILRRFNAVIAENKTTALLGESGLGKTTLLRLIAGLDNDFTGEISHVPERLTFLFQENALLPWRNVIENISFPVKDVFKKEEIKRKIEELLVLTFLTGHEHKYPHELSGGMQRRVALCRALIYPAELLLLDEPFSGLDDTMKNKIIDGVLAELGDRKTIVIVTHDETVIDRCDAKIYLND
jgi:ABC-type nitrate/sulfonate/bicarbonate transport system ATPase subunit